MHFLYILYSQKVDRYYVGETTDVEQRLQDHNTHKYKRSFTKAAEDWQIVLKMELADREKALFLESFIKRMKSKKFIQKIVQNPEILQDMIKNR